MNLAGAVTAHAFLRGPYSAFRLKVFSTCGMISTGPTIPERSIFGRISWDDPTARVLASVFVALIFRGFRRLRELGDVHAIGTPD
jgi:hypothetical protein